MSDNIKTLRQHLFDALKRLSEAKESKDLQIEAEKACSLVQVTECILETVKVEAALLQQMKQSGSEFILIEKEEKKTPLVNNNHFPSRKINNGLGVESTETNNPVQYFEESLLEPTP